MVIFKSDKIPRVNKETIITPSIPSNPSPHDKPKSSILPGDVPYDSFTGEKKKNKKWVFFVLGFAVVLAVIIIILFFVMKSDKTLNSEERNPIEDSFSDDNSLGNETSPSDKSSFGSCWIFPSEELSSCIPYSCDFTHPVTGERLNRSIEGIVDGKCKFAEDVDTVQTRRCALSEETRRAIARYYSDAYSGNSSKFNYIVNGSVTMDPIEEAERIGECHLVAK